MTEYVTHETNHSRPWLFLTKRFDLTEEEAKEVMMRHWKREHREAQYRAAQRALQEARDISYERASILGKLLLRWKWLVKNYA